MNSLIKFIKRVLSKFNILIYKIPSNITVKTIKKQTIEHLATSYYIKQLISLYLFQRRYDLINHLINELIPTKKDYSHLYWINNESSGRGSLDIYRVVQKKKSKFFIKYYFTESIEQQRVLFFYDYVNIIISNKINAFNIESVINSEMLTEVIFEFIEDDIDHNNESLNFIIDFLNTMHNNFNIKTFIKKKIAIPQYLLNYKNHFEYKRSKSEIFEKSALTLQNLISELETKINADDLVLSHGDIHYGNIKSGRLLDWDNFGFYPVGFDASFAFWKMNLNINCNNTVINFIKTNFFKYDNFKDSEKNKFTRNFIFFLLVFSKNKHEWMSKFLSN